MRYDHPGPHWQRKCFTVKSYHPFLENITDLRIPEIQTPHYYGEIRALIRDPPIKPKDIIPINLDVRIQDQFHVPKAITCQIISKYENISETLLLEFKMKNKAIAHTHFDWHVPNTIGLVKICLRLIIDNIPVSRKNIEYTPLQLEITRYV